MTTTTKTRNDFHALLTIPDFVAQLRREAAEAGVFQAGIISDKKHRGTAINVDVYGYDEAQNLAVVQVRQCIFHPRRWNKVRKDYYLLGHTEDGAVFAHAIASPARSTTAMASPEQCVAWVLAQIWGCAIADLPEIVRQGDIAFVPASLPAAAVLLDVQQITIRGSHIITAEHIWQHGDTYYTTRKAKAVHTKRQHGTVKANGCYRVQAGVRAETWGFTVPTRD